ncbi:MAG TPA: hypothetical protein VG870_08670 [Chitinophagaceae bacterium]|nr:hypothetical protein [Chitinophagaceae bacterium]
MKGKCKLASITPPVLPAWRLASVCLVLLLAAGRPLAQGNDASDLGRAFSSYARHHLREELFVHTDQSFYMAGQVLWCKIYCVDGGLHRPLDLSRVVYLELLDDQHKAVVQAKLAMDKGLADGSLVIPASLGSGRYLLRAYTRWMRNFSADDYFEKIITVVNTFKSAQVTSPQPGGRYDIQFFPEGGDLVRGLPAQVGLRAVDPGGRGIECTGVVLDQNNDTVAHFRTARFGLGQFPFTPLPGKQYRALVHSDGDSSFPAALPPIREQGYALHLQDPGDGDLLLTVTGNVTGEHTVYLLVHTRQLLKRAETQQLVNGQARFVIPRDQLGPGISCFTLFNARRTAVAERLYFKKPPVLDVALRTDSASYASRSRVTVDLATGSGSTGYRSANLSMAVFRTDSLQPADQDDLASYFWLGADLRGHIESPSYYLTQDGPEAAQAADNLMLTQGWRHFRWEDVWKDSSGSPAFLPEYEGHLVTGRLVDHRTGQPAGGVTAYLSAPGRKIQFYAATSTPDGSLLFNTREMAGGNRLIIQTDYRKDSTYRVDILTPFSESYSGTRLPALHLAPDLRDPLLIHSISNQLQHAFRDSMLNRFTSPFPDTVNFYGKADKVYYLDDYTRFTTMEEVLREYVQEVAVRRQDRRFRLFMVREDRGLYEEDPLRLVDGVPVFSSDSIIALDPLKIQKIDILARKYYRGPLVSEGIVSFSTYKGDLDGLRLDPAALEIEYEGLQLRREFFAPVYDTPEQRASRLPDFRCLLYWNPRLETGPEGHRQLSFYTSDQPGTYVVFTQGLSADGVSGFGSLHFTVR